MTEHTATPWIVDLDTINPMGFASWLFAIRGDLDYTQLEVALLRFDENDGGIEEVEANATFIVKACNRDHLFDDLVDSLSHLANKSRDLTNNLKDAGQQLDDDGFIFRDISETTDAIFDAEAVLAKAQEANEQ